MLCYRRIAYFGPHYCNITVSNGIYKAGVFPLPMSVQTTVDNLINALGIIINYDARNAPTGKLSVAM